MKLLKNKHLVLNIINGLLPLFGILFLKWSVLDVFALFIIELMLIGSFTVMKILFAGGKNGNKWSSLFFFLLLFPIVFIIIFILLGNFFDLRNRQMSFTLTHNSIYFLLAVYLFNFIYYYIIKGEYKISLSKKISENALLKMGAIFTILMVILLPISKFIPADAQGILMGVAIAICRLLIDNFIDQKLSNQT